MTTENQTQPSIFQAVSLGVLTSAGKLLSGLIRSKVTAVVLGASGLGTIAEIQQVVQVAMVPTTFATGPALLDALSSAKESGNRERAAKVYQAAVTLSLLASMICIPAGVGLAWVVLPEYASGHWSLLCALAGLSLALVSFQTLHRQPLIVSGHLPQLARLDLLYLALAGSLVPLAVWIFGIPGYFFGMVIVAGCSVIPFVRAARSFAVFSEWRFRLRIDRSYILSAIKFGGATFISISVLQAGLLAIRATLSATGGAELNGLFQAAWVFGFINFQALLSSAGNFLWPRYAAASDSAELTSEIHAAIGFMKTYLVPLVLLVIAFRYLIVVTAYSSEFAASGDLLGMMFAGNLCRIFGWPFLDALLFRQQKFIWVLSQTIGWVSFAIGVSLLVTDFGLIGIGWAYVGSNVLQMFVLRLVSFIFLDVSSSLPELILVTVSAIGLSVLITIPEATHVLSGCLVLVSVLWAWLFGWHTTIMARLRKREPR